MREANDMQALANELAQRARDAAYVAVGLGLLGFQRIQANRRTVSSFGARPHQADDRLVQLRTGLFEGARQLADWADATVQMVSESVAPLEAQLPEPAREVAAKARAGLCAIGAQLRQVASPGA